MTNKFVIDTNTLISGSMFANSTTSLAIDKALEIGDFYFSNETFEEFISVLFRPKFDKYFIDENQRWLIIDRFERFAKFKNPEIVITDCRDPKDNKFLELACTINADCLITGDEDLLILNPFRNIPVLNSAQFIEKF
ncbi:MAG: putative toxin-antitoxin system toxin component, PIN family [Bacteroidetes bacterium]|nr:putative toxin-antitoxin system toxin component, PIN family [Bacteroidota bacterium]